MQPLLPDPPSVEAALSDLRNAYQGFSAPTHLCRQCYDPVWDDRFARAARQISQGKTPSPRDFAQIYYEHPACSGGEETAMLFFPSAIETLLPHAPLDGFGSFPPEILEGTMRAGFWFWPRPLIAAIHPLACRLFHDWFDAGRFDLSGLPDGADPKDAILELCAMALIDPAEIVAALAARGGFQADDALLNLFFGSSLEAPFYCSADTQTDNETYLTAIKALTGSLQAHEARAVLDVITPSWLEAAFYRYADTHPRFARELSDANTYYDIKAMSARARAKQDDVPVWPDLPLIRI
ncbi:hypothetical protein CFI11_22910 [Thalassococcus sp. S3]|nr:hypothetical protein CFI11_22910 [Thalassococcus sp. S3]